MSKMPIEKPSCEELKRMQPIPGYPKQDKNGLLIQKYAIFYPLSGDQMVCRQSDRVIETHRDGESLTWWECFGRDRQVK